MSRAKAMGTAVETAACRWLVEYGFPKTERLALAGAADRGDLRLQQDPTVIAECKRAQRGIQLTSWMRELDVEITNSGAETGLLIAKQRGAGDRSVHRWVAAMHIRHFEQLRIRCDRSHGIPEWVRVVDWSPVKINNGYIPECLASGNGVVPFARTFQSGNGNRWFVLGPLRQMSALLRAAGYGEEENGGS